MKNIIILVLAVLITALCFYDLGAAYPNHKPIHDTLKIRDTTIVPMIIIPCKDTKPNIKINKAD